MQSNQIPLLSIHTTFQKWKKTRKDLKRIEKRINNQDAILTPSETMIPPEIFGEYKNIVVEGWRRIFCQQILFSIERHKDRTMYEIHARWDIEMEHMSDLIERHECNVLWDSVVAVPRLGFAQCLVLSDVRGLKTSDTFIPVDQVEDVEAWAVV